MQALKSGRHPALKEHTEIERGEYLIPSSDFYMHSGGADRQRQMIDR